MLTMTFDTTTRRTRPLLAYKVAGMPDLARAYIALDLEKGAVYAGSFPLDDCQPEPVVFGRVRWYHVPPRITKRELLRLIKSLMPLLERVAAGSTIKWTEGNWRTYLTPDALSAEDEIVAACQQIFEDPAYM